MSIFSYRLFLATTKIDPQLRIINPLPTTYVYTMFMTMLTSLRRSLSVSLKVEINYLSRYTIPFNKLQLI